MGSNETATATTGGPRVMDVFDGDRAPSGPNYLLFSDVDRLPDTLRDRSGVGQSPTPHAPLLGAPERALDPKLVGLGLWPIDLAERVAHLYLPMDAPRMRRRRLRTSSTIIKRPRETSGPRMDWIPLARPL